MALEHDTAVSSPLPVAPEVLTRPADGATAAVLGTPRPAPKSPPRPVEPTPAATAVAEFAPHAAAEGIEAAAGPDHDEPRLLNRELSRLDYYARVLSNAGDGQLPLLER